MRRVLILAMIVMAAGADGTLTTFGPPPTLGERLQMSSVVIRGRVIGVKRVDSKRIVHYMDSTGDEPFPRAEFQVVAERVFKGCVRPGDRIRIEQSSGMTGGSVNIGKGDRAILMMQGNGDSYGVHYEIPVRNGVPGVETEFRSWPVEILEARIDSIIATLPRDSVVSDSNHTLLQDFGSITGQIVSRYDGALHARYDIQVVLDNGRTATTNSWGTFHLEGRAGTHVLTFPGTAIEPKKVRIRAGCFDFVQITAPR